MFSQETDAMEIEKSFKRLLIKDPFYGLFCLSLPKVITRKIPTLCVTQQGINCQLNINPDFWGQFNDDEQIALLKHELGHIALQHIFISDSFPDKKGFNIAADCEVNSNIENLPACACTAQKLSSKLGVHLENNMGTKAYYEALTGNRQQKANAQNPQSPCNGGQGGESEQDSPSSSSPSEAPESDEKEKKEPPSPPQQDKEEPKEEEPQKAPEQYPDEFKDDFEAVDDHSTWKDFQRLPEANRQLMQNNINSILKQTAEQVERSRGTIPGEFVSMIEKLREKKPPVFDWKSYFRRLLGSIYDINLRMTRRKESKRFEGNAGVQHKKKVSILVAVDTSGSVSDRELQEFFAEIDHVYNAGARVTIIECDTKINSITEYDGKTLPKIHGRGGTEFDPPVDYYLKNKKDYAALIYFTDGECTLPKNRPSGMVWVITPGGLHQDYPGKVIYIPNRNNN